MLEGGKGIDLLKPHQITASRASTLGHREAEIRSDRETVRGQRSDRFVSGSTYGMEYWESQSRW